MFSIHIIYLTVISAILYYFYWSVHAIYDLVKPIARWQVLRDQGDNPKIYEPSLHIVNANNKNVILIIHGAWSNPAFHSNIMENIKEHYPDCDIAMSLLHNHGSSLRDLAKFDYEIAVKNIIDDIKYLSDKYNKVLCIGHSLGGLILTDIAISDHSIDANKLYIILYEPAIIVTTSLLVKIAIFVSGSLFDFLIHHMMNGFFDHMQYKYIQLPVTKIVNDAICKNSEIVQNKITINNFKYKFSYIMNINSLAINAAQIKSILDKSDKKIGDGVYFTFSHSKNNRHTLHGERKEDVEQFFNKLNEVIDAIKTAW